MDIATSTINNAFYISNLSTDTAFDSISYSSGFFLQTIRLLEDKAQNILVIYTDRTYI